MDPSELAGVIVTESLFNPRANRVKMIELLFEFFDVNSAYIALQPIMSLYAVGRLTGIVVDAGYDKTQTVSVNEGYVIPHSGEKHDVAGRKLDDYARRLFNEKGHNFTTF